MNIITSLRVNNWRRFDAIHINLPTKSAIIIDNNGSGKTSILAALYSLLTKEPWPQTKYIDHLKVNEQYFGVSTLDKSWELLGKINPSGRMSIKHTIPDFEAIPKALTYTPDDNAWLFNSRSLKLQILDTLLSQIYDDEYIQPLKLLEKAIKQKNSTLKHSIEEQKPPDELLLKTLHGIIIENSIKLWKLRWHYLKTLLEGLQGFESWIQSPLMNWTITLEIQSLRTIKLKLSDIESWDYVQNILEGELLQSNVVELLQQQEKYAGRALYGAQRDNFEIASNHRLIQTILSRGEMRLLILFTRKIAYDLIISQNTTTPVYFLLDDIFNELDEERENTTYRLILESFDFWLATGTKRVHVDIPTYNINELLAQ